MLPNYVIDDMCMYTIGDLAQMGYGSRTTIWREMKRDASFPYVKQGSRLVLAEERKRLKGKARRQGEALAQLIGYEIALRCRFHGAAALAAENLSWVNDDALMMRLETKNRARKVMLL